MRRKFVAHGIEHTEKFNLHDLRKGAAQQLVANGSPLTVILKAGSWGSRAFAIYLD